MTMHNWLSVYAGNAPADFVYFDEGIEVTEIFHPEIPWECWREKPIDPQKAWEAVVAMCGG
jgi:hypothetical protein